MSSDTRPWPFGYAASSSGGGSSRASQGVPSGVVNSPASLRRLSPTRDAGAAAASPALGSLGVGARPPPPPQPTTPYGTPRHRSTAAPPQAPPSAGPTQRDLAVALSQAERERDMLRQQARDMREALVNSQSVINASFQQQQPQPQQQQHQHRQYTAHQPPPPPVSPKKEKTRGLADNPWVQSLFRSGSGRRGSASPLRASGGGGGGGGGGGVMRSAADWEEKLATARAEQAAVQRELEDLQGFPLSDAEARTRVVELQGAAAQKAALIQHLETLLSDRQQIRAAGAGRSVDTQTDLERPVFFDKIPVTLGSLYAFYPQATDAPINLSDGADVCLDMTPATVMHLQRQVADLTVKCTQLTCELAVAKKQQKQDQASYPSAYPAPVPSYPFGYPSHHHHHHHHQYQHLQQHVPVHDDHRLIAADVRHPQYHPAAPYNPQSQHSEPHSHSSHHAQQQQQQQPTPPTNYSSNQHSSASNTQVAPPQQQYQQVQQQPPSQPPSQPLSQPPSQPQQQYQQPPPPQRPQAEEPTPTPAAPPQPHPSQPQQQQAPPPLPTPASPPNAAPAPEPAPASVPSTPSVAPAAGGGGGSSGAVAKLGFVGESHPAKPGKSPGVFIPFASMSVPADEPLKNSEEAILAKLGLSSLTAARWFRNASKLPDFSPAQEIDLSKSPDEQQFPKSTVVYVQSG